MVFDAARKAKFVGVGGSWALFKFFRGVGWIFGPDKVKMNKSFTCAPRILFSTSGNPLGWHGGPAPRMAQRADTSACTAGRHHALQNMIMLIMLMIIMLRIFG